MRLLDLDSQSLRVVWQEAMTLTDTYFGDGGADPLLLIVGIVISVLVYLVYRNSTTHPGYRREDLDERVEERPASKDDE
jgi:hypothetical protein